MRIPSLFAAFLAAFAALVVCTTVVSVTSHATPVSETSPMTMFDSITACDEVRRSSNSSINCIVTYVQGHATLAVEFVNERSMQANFGAFSKQVADPFCKAANKDDAGAYLVVALRNPRVGSASACKTGESTGWVSLDRLAQS
jgi:hypothetical protein